MPCSCCLLSPFFSFGIDCLSLLLFTVPGSTPSRFYFISFLCLTPEYLNSTYWLVSQSSCSSPSQSQMLLDHLFSSQPVISSLDVSRILNLETIKQFYKSVPTIWSPDGAQQRPANLFQGPSYVLYNFLYLLFLTKLITLYFL